MNIQSISVTFEKTMQVEDYEPAKWGCTLVGTPNDGDTVASASEELHRMAEESVREQIKLFYKKRRERESLRKAKVHTPTSFDPVSEAIEPKEEEKPPSPSAEALAFAMDMIPKKNSNKNGYSKRTTKKK